MTTKKSKAAAKPASGTNAPAENVTKPKFDIEVKKANVAKVQGIAYKASAGAAAEEGNFVLGDAPITKPIGGSGYHIAVHGDWIQKTITVKVGKYFEAGGFGTEKEEIVEL